MRYNYLVLILLFFSSSSLDAKTMLTENSRFNSGNTSRSSVTKSDNLFFSNHGSFKSSTSFSSNEVDIIVPFLTTNRKYKLYNTSSKTHVSEKLYDDIQPVNNELFIVTISGKKGLINGSGKNIALATYDCFDPVGDSHLIFQLGSKFGLMNFDGKTIIQPIYDALQASGDTILITSMQTGKIVKSGIVDLGGKVLVDNKFRELQVIDQNQLIVSLDKKLHYLADAKGNLISSPYSKIDADRIVGNKGKFGILNAQGKLIVPTIYNRIYKLETDYFVAENIEQKTGLFDSQGKIAIPFDKYSIYSLGEGMYSLDRSLYQKITKPSISLYSVPLKKVINSTLFEDLGTFNEGLAYFKLSGKIGFLNTEGEIVIAPIFDSSAGILMPTDVDFGSIVMADQMTMDDGADGYDDGGAESGDILNSFCFYDQIEKPQNLGALDATSTLDFLSGVSVVALGEKVGAIDHTGKIIVPITYDYLTPFRNGVAIGVVKISDQQFKPYLIYSDGRIVLEDYVIHTWLGVDRIVLANRKLELFDVSLTGKDSKVLNKEIFNIERYSNYIRYNYKDAVIYSDENFHAFAADNIDFSEFDSQKNVQAGNSYQLEKEYDKAIVEFKKALKLDIDNVYAFIGMAEAYKGQSNLYEAIKYADKALAVSTDFNKLQILTLKFEIFKAQSNLDQAIEVASQIINQFDDAKYQWYIERGLIKMQGGKFNDAIDDFSASMGGLFTSYKGYVYNMRGVCYSRLNMQTNALSDFKKATVLGVQESESESNIGLYFYNLGNTFARLTKKVEALAAYKKSAAYGNKDAARAMRSTFFKK